MRGDEMRTRDGIAHRRAARDDLRRRFQPLEVGPQLATRDVRTARQRCDALHDIEVPRCSFDNAAEHVAKHHGRIFLSQTAAERDREARRDRDRSWICGRSDDAPITTLELDDRDRSNGAKLEPADGNVRREPRGDRTGERARRVGVVDRSEHR
ncbi:MAG TPA: hypothetical protein VGL61_33960 [Kofleriaceae bacterium]